MIFSALLALPRLLYLLSFLSASPYLVREPGMLMLRCAVEAVVAVVGAGGPGLVTRLHWRMLS